MSDPTQTPEATVPTATAPKTIDELLSPFQREATATRMAVEDRLRVLRRIAEWLAVFVTVTVVLVALVLVILVQNRQTSAKTRAAINSNAALSAQIVDCTSVGGRCYQQSQANLRNTINLLVESNKAIAQCARSTDTDAELDACVDAKLAPLKVTPTPRPAPTN